jgi:hypothetical protein
MELHHQHKLGDDPLLVYNLHFITRVAKGFITDRKRYTHTHTHTQSRVLTYRYWILKMVGSRVQVHHMHSPLDALTMLIDILAICGLATAGRPDYKLRVSRHEESSSSR